MTCTELKIHIILGTISYGSLGELLRATKDLDLLRTTVKYCNPRQFKKVVYSIMYNYNRPMDVTIRCGLRTWKCRSHYSWRMKSGSTFIKPPFFLK